MNLKYRILASVFAVALVPAACGKSIEKSAATTSVKSSSAAPTTAKTTTTAADATTTTARQSSKEVQGVVDTWKTQRSKGWNKGFVFEDSEIACMADSVLTNAPTSVRNVLVRATSMPSDQVPYGFDQLKSDDPDGTVSEALALALAKCVPIVDVTARSYAAAPSFAGRTDAELVTFKDCLTAQIGGLSNDEVMAVYLSELFGLYKYQRPAAWKAVESADPEKNPCL